jgi:glycosyltransferase involved in cell wall biosynthesis
MLRAVTISDIIHADDSNVVSLYGTGEGVSVPYLRTLHPDIPILFWVFAAPHIDIKRFDNVRRLFGTAVKETDVLAASSNYCAGAVELLSPAHNQEIRVVYFGVDSDRFPSKLDKTEAREQLGLDTEGGGKIVMFLDRMEPEVGISSALEIAEKNHFDSRECSVLNLWCKGLIDTASERIDDHRCASNSIFIRR